MKRLVALSATLVVTSSLMASEHPGVVMENVHHLVGLVQWACFPDQVLDWRKDVKVSSARIWPTALTLAQFRQVTGLDAWPEFLRSEVDANGVLQVRQNGAVNYTLRGVQVKVTARWNVEAPPGAKDTHYSLLRGTRAHLVIKQGAEQNYAPTIYIENVSGVAAADFEKSVRVAVARLAKQWPGVAVKPAGAAWEIVVPKKYSVGHEAHFAQVTENYLRYLAAGKLPKWETAGMLAKYFTTTEAYRLSR